MSMRQKANLSLILLALLFLIASVLLYYYPGQWWLRLLLYTAEAGLVGAIADLFAVTVLFRHPLGIRWFPHTAIIPRNRDKLVDGVATMVEEKLLSKSVLYEKLQEINLVDAIIGWIDRKPNNRTFAEQGWELFLSWLRGANLEILANKLDQDSRSALRKMNLSLYAGKGLTWFLKNSDFQMWLGQIVDYAANKSSDKVTKEAIRAALVKEKDKYVSEGGSFVRWFKHKLVELAEAADAINLDDAANTLYNDLQSFLKELHHPKHELRVLIENQMLELANKLETSEDFAEAIEAWKLELLKELSLQPSIHALLASIRSMILGEEEIKYMIVKERTIQVEDIKQWVISILDSYWVGFKADEETKAQLNIYIRGLVVGMAMQEHAVIGRIARRTLEGFTEDRLVEFIESKVEMDLQRIRLNGALIGAAVGALLFLLLHGVYAPLLANV